MQIKTAVTLAGGAAVGFFFGICATEETKGKIVSGIKDRIIGYMTGEHMNRKPATYRGMKYEAKPVRKPKEWKEFNWDTFKTEKLIFPTEEKAKEILKWMRYYVNTFKCLSVYGLTIMLGEAPPDYTWNRYGWKQSATEFATVELVEDDPVHHGWYRILITDPYLID